METERKNRHDKERDKERERMVREMAFLYKRLTIDEARAVFQHMKWDKDKAFKFVREAEPKEIRKVTGQPEEIIKALQTDASIIDTLQNGIKSDTRQFACESCDNMWWRKVPISKQVSECKKCKGKYDPVPKEYEWGWAIYECDCGNEFGNRAQKKTSAPCYQCGESIYPSVVKPFWKQRGRKDRRNQHCCDAPDCTGHAPIPIHDVDPDRIYDDGTTNRGPGKVPSEDSVSVRSKDVEYSNVKDESSSVSSRNGSTSRSKPKQKDIQTCVSSVSRQHKKDVIYPSEPHISTGSTVGTFLSQSDDNYSFVSDLASIPEH